MPLESLLRPGVAVAINLIIPLALLLGLLYRRRAYLAWTSASALGIAIAWARGDLSPRALLVLAGALVALALITGLPPVRRLLVSRWVMALLGPILPRIGETERIALEAGTVWWDRDLFSGDIDWRKLMSFDPGTLSATESAFLDGPVRELCGMLDEWEISRSGDLPPEVWRFLKEKKFLGMIIPEEYGGLGFSARAHSAVVTRLASRSLTAAVTVMVPNSLGPAELILHYGTPEQKSRYLPRLATGDEIPCFALTGPEAGSDAAATRSEGIVCRGLFEGREVLGMRLSWNKRYITLAPVATVIGLAFRLRDPDHLLGDREDLGITCALIPAALPGVETGQRHDPLGIPFLNGPTFGTDVFVPLDVIIGGREMAGQGWRMLMERLAAGRSISLPALSVAASQLATRVTGAYGTIREQFGLPIGRFEGIEEPLARIGGMTYLMSAAASLTAGAVDSGQSPAVLSAVVKAYLTDGMRSVVNDAMDIVAGAGICRGPRNTLALAYQALPIAITVEGANILTRSMIIFGQGSIRSHPFVQEEIRAVEARDVRRFDRAFFGHAGAFFANATRAMVLGLTGGRMAGGGVDPRVRSYAGRLSRMSAAFAVVADAAMATLGGTLKRKEKITGRLADALAWLYLGTASLKRFHDEGCRSSDLPYVRWASHLAIHRIQQALLGTLDNLPGRFVARLLRPVIFPRGALSRPPSDGLGSSVARGLLDGGEARERLTTGVHLPGPEEPGLGRLEAALGVVLAARPARRKLADAVRHRRLPKLPPEVLAPMAEAEGILDASERASIEAAEKIRDEVVQVDAFAEIRSDPGGPDGSDARRQAAPHVTV